MDDPQQCKACGTDLEADAGPEGLCPRCLLKLALPEGRPEEATETELPPESSSQMIGPYRLLQKVGEGGMGEVWEAEQLEPVKRKVALKLIKAGMDTKQVVARFESERQALAMMDHPGIAKVFDAGATEQGRPYFVMEYVSGLPITEYCDSERLNTKERLELFMQVCEGVQHAHHKGIIHRDIKPSNVLVQLQDGKPVPKIIDFGVAKATQQRLTEKTLFTQFGVMVGTPAYMSPEQAELTGLDVDTRTDVYSLGVLLYELLVGALPFDPRALREAGFDEIRRVIREEEPSKPSTRFGTLSGEESSDSAKRRQTDLKALARDLRGDLDWITMRALEKNRARRYGSPSDLAEDIQRHLSHEPVKAGPPSATYRAGRFIRRHRLGVSAATLVVLALVIGLGAATWGLVEARRANEEARQQAQTAEQVSEFLVDLFEVSDPSEARGNTITAREVLDRGARSIEEELADQPQVKAQLIYTLGNVYRNLGLYEEAEPLLDKALAEQRELVGELNPATLKTTGRLAFLYVLTGQYEKAERLNLEALEAARRGLGEGHPSTLKAMNHLANVYRLQGRYDEAEPLFREALEAQRLTLGVDNPVTRTTMTNFAVLLASQGRCEEAESLFVQVLEADRRTLGEDHPDTLGTTARLGNLYRLCGRSEEAEPLVLQALEGMRKVLGLRHSRTLDTMVDLARVHASMGRYDEAEELLVEVVDVDRRQMGADNPDTLTAMSTLASVYRQQGRYDEAERLCLEALAAGRRVRGNDHPFTLGTLYELARIRSARGENESALELLRESIEGGFTNFGNPGEILQDWNAFEGNPEYEAIVSGLKGQIESR